MFFVMLFLLWLRNDFLVFILIIVIFFDLLWWSACLCGNSELRGDSWRLDWSSIDNLLLWGLGHRLLLLRVSFVLVVVSMSHLLLQLFLSLMLRFGIVILFDD